MSQSNQHIEVVPSNVTSDGTISFVNGQPVMQFIIGSQDRFIQGSSIRLTGNFGLLEDVGDLPDNADNLLMDNRIGIYSCVDQIVIKSQRTNQTIETIKNYGRFMKSYVASTQSPQDALSYVTAHSLANANQSAMETAITLNQNNLGKNPNPFCMPLPCGLFNSGSPIPLSDTWGLGGMIVEVHLSPDSNVLYNGDANAANIANAFYQFKNVTLCAELSTPGDDDLNKLRSMDGNTLEFNSISSYYSTFNSTNAIINFNLGLSRVLGVFCNIVPSTYINNRSQNGMQTIYPVGGSPDPSNDAPIKQVVFTRGGERLPLQYNIDTLKRGSGLSESADPQIYRNYINAVYSFVKNMRQQSCPANMRYGDATDSLGNGNDNLDIWGGKNVGVGVAFDTISGEGLNFQSVPFGIQMETALTDDQPQSLYMYVHSKQTLIFNQTGIQIVK